MRFLLSGFLVLSCIAMTFGAASIEKSQGKFDGICKPTQYNTGPIPVNEVRRLPGQCGQASCEKNGDIIYMSCGVIAGKVIKGDQSLPYPRCCDRPA